MGVFDRLWGPMAKPAFARRAAATLQAAGIEVDSIDYESFSVKTASDSMLSLNNLYEEYRQAPRATRNEVFDRVVHSAMGPDVGEMTFEQARPGLLPKLNARQYYESLELQAKALGADGAPEVLWRKVGETHGVEVAHDSEYRISSITPDMASSWGVDQEELFEFARENMWQISNQPWQELQPGLYAAPWGDNWDAGRVYLYDLIWQLKVKGRHVITTPNRDTVLVTGEQDIEGMSRLAELTEQITRDAPRPISFAPLVLESREWQSLTTENCAPAVKPIVHRLTLLDRLLNADRQKGLLDEIYKRHGQDIFVATLTGTEDETDGSLFTYAVWSNGVETLLPEADKIAIMETLKGDPRLVPWEEVQGQYGHLLSLEDGHWPARWRTLGFPAK